MALLITIGLLLLGFRALQRAAMLIVDVIATLLAAYYHWRSQRVTAAILAGPTGRRARRLLAKRLTLAINMTELMSMLPYSACRGCRLADAFAAWRR